MCLTHYPHLKWQFEILSVHAPRSTPPFFVKESWNVSKKKGNITSDAVQRKKKNSTIHVQSLDGLKNQDFERVC